MYGAPIDLSGRELRVTTRASVWLLRDHSYCRLPRLEAPRLREAPALADGVWLPHVGAWLVADPVKGLCVRLLPPDRPDGSHGIITGSVESITPPP